MNPFLTLASNGFWRWFLPEQATPEAQTTDFVIQFIFWISLFFFVLIMVVGTVFLVKYRNRKGADPGESPNKHYGLELTWTGIPLVLVVIIFAVGFTPYMNMYTPPQDSYEVMVTAVKWHWEFTYTLEDGTTHTERNVLHVPSGRPVRLVLTSQDVVHSLFLPEFRLKRDAVPGRYTKVWFEADRPGEYPLYCAEYCGRDHSLMTGTIVVHESGGFETWLAGAAFDPLEVLSDEQYKVYQEQGLEALKEQFPASEYPDLQKVYESDKLVSLPEKGRNLYREKGCVTCHTVDGSMKAGGGPSFLGLWTRTENGSTVLSNGRNLGQFLDQNYTPEDYVRESIIEPNAKIVQGFRSGSMTSYKGRITDREIMALIAFFKQLDKQEGN